MDRAYQAGARIARDRIEREAPLDGDALSKIQASDIVVVDGTYDSVETVLDALAMPYTKISPGDLGTLPLRPSQLVVINCPGHLDRLAVLRVRDFVADGGSLFTTDWALRHVIEPAFPDTLRYNDRPTADDVVRVEVADASNPFLTGVIDPGQDPLWWLEGSSYPIRVVGDGVKVLVRSSELEAKYGEAAVAVVFGHGAGEVFHMISHYYLQRTQSRDARAKSSAAAYAASKKVIIDDELVEGLSTGDVESAASSARFLANVVARKKRS